MNRSGRERVIPSEEPDVPADHSQAASSVLPSGPTHGSGGLGPALGALRVVLATFVIETEL